MGLSENGIYVQYIVANSCESQQHIVGIPSFPDSPCMSSNTVVNSSFDESENDYHGLVAGVTFWHEGLSNKVKPRIGKGQM